MNWPFNFGFRNSVDAGECALETIFPLNLTCDAFTQADIVNTYIKILTDVVDRTHGLSDDEKPLMFDNCLQSESNQGLISLLACAMRDKKDLFLVFAEDVGVLRKADTEEEETIKADYKKKGESDTGVYISFKNYRRTDMLNIYSNFEYCVIASLNKTLNISKSIQIKVNELRSTVAMADSSVARSQAQSIAKGLGAGKDVMLDAKDEITSATPDTASSEKSIDFLDSKRAFILGLPMSYISGYQTEGIGSTGEADMRAVERGLKQYFVSIIQPVLKALFDVDAEFKSQDFRQMESAIELLKGFDLVSDDYLSKESKQAIVARIFDLDEDDEAKQIETEQKQAEKDSAKNPPPLVVVGQSNGFDKTQKAPTQTPQ